MSRAAQHPLDDVEISVLLVTHDHASFIDEATQGIDLQETDRAVEVVVADDASTDDTAEALRYWAKRSARPVRVLPAEPPLGITANFRRGFSACHGRYIAVLEGDDRWLVGDKLDTQAQFLDRRHECAFVFNRFIRQFDTGRSVVFPDLGLEGPETTFTGVELANDNFVGNFSACMYRADLVARVHPGIYSLVMYDWLFNLAMTGFGEIGFLPRVMSAYRVHQHGAWSGLEPAAQGDILAELIWQYSDFLGPRYAPELAAYRRRLYADLRDRTGTSFHAP